MGLKRQKSGSSYAFWDAGVYQSNRFHSWIAPAIQRGEKGPVPDLVRVEPIALLPTPAGCAVFLGDGKKSIVFYIDLAIGASINAALAGETPPRPLTHDLYLLTLEAFGAKVRRAVIVAIDKEIYYASLILEAENEIMERKIVELDARPSDCIAIAVRAGAPIFVVRELWDSLEDMTSVLQDMRDKGMDLGGGS
jgi:bifunctional DNase/RNase